MLLKLFETPLSNKCPQREPGISKTIQFNQILNLFLMSTGCLVLQALRLYQVASTLILFSLSGCKENHLYSLPFGQAEASIY